MKEKLLRKTLVTLLAIVLSVTFTFSDYATVNAEDETNNETTTNTSDEKELVQYDDDWVIFKYKDENGNPKFDITYQGKSIEQIEEEGFYFQYTIVPMNNYFDDVGFFKSYIGSYGSEDFSQYTNDCIILFRLWRSTEETLDLYNSDAIPLFSYDYPCITSTNYGYLYRYDSTKNNPTNFKVSVKLNEQLETNNDEMYIYMNSHLDDRFNIGYSASNLSFENYSETYTIDGKTYEYNYSILSFDIELPKEVEYADLSYDSVIVCMEYTFSFDGIRGVNSHLEPQDLLMTVDTTFVKDDGNSDVTVEPTTVATTVNPANNLTTTVNSVASGSDVTTNSVTGQNKSDANNKKAIITAKKIKVKKIKLKAKKTLKAGKKLKIKATVTPKNATNKKLTWKSSNKKYATVNSKGVVKAKKAGKGKTVKITAKAKDGSGKKATIKIKIV